MSVDDKNNSGTRNGIIPSFQYRPNKFVDRMLFLDLINRAVPERGAENYVYISMGAKFLQDHHSVYRRTGINSLISFDREVDDIKRQKFNRPTDKMVCEKMDSSDLPGRLNDIRGNKNVIVWLDFMNPKELRLQLEQSQAVIERMVPGDMFRITMNARYKNFGNFNLDAQKKYKKKSNMVAAVLKERIEEYLPEGLQKVQESELSSVLANTLKYVSLSALGRRRNVEAVPVLSTTYADKQRMVTAACLIRRSNQKDIPKSLSRWKFLPKDWNDVLDINVPDLSAREKHYLDRELGNTPTEILRGLPFKSGHKDHDLMLKDTISSYKKFHRYYPAFHHVDF